MVFQFGDFTADDEAHELRRGSQSVHVSPKTFELLILLLRSRPRALSKADLHASVWPRTFVSDASLAMLVAELRAALDDIKQRTRTRTITPEEMRDYTFTLSNFGTLAGRYATPLVVPPTVAILGAGKLQRDVVAGPTAPEIHVRLPLSLTFDHRCITGGEACRFLAAVIADLQLPS